MAETNRVEVKRWEFETFKGSFELKRTGWVDIIDPNGAHATINRSQILAMAEILKKEKPARPKHILKD
jgi:hypothetical protein